MVCNSCNR